jgi:nucleotide-binding universal stress UspA family protein
VVTGSILPPSEPRDLEGQGTDAIASDSNGPRQVQLGSTAESVIREATCPVMTVRGLVAGDAVRSHRHVRLHRLLVATDFSTCSHVALRFATGLARRMESELMLLHVVETPARGSGVGVEVESSVGQAQSRGQLTRLPSVLRTKGVTAEGHCVEGEPIHVILTQAAEWGVDAIVIGTQGRRGLRRLMLGSLANRWSDARAVRCSP